MPPSIIQLQRELEDFPDEKLIQEAQQPTEYPAFLSTQELKRRASLREKYQAREAQVPQGTVAEREVEKAIQNLAPMGPMAGAQPPGMPPQGGPPQGGPPQGGPPQGMPPQGGPPQGGPPQGMPPQGGPPPMAMGGIVGLQEGGMSGRDMLDIIRENNYSRADFERTPEGTYRFTRDAKNRYKIPGHYSSWLDEDAGIADRRQNIPDQDDIPFEGWTTEEKLEDEYHRQMEENDRKRKRRQRIRGKIGLGGKLIKGIGALGLGAELLMGPERLGAGTVPEPGRTAEERKALMDHARSSMEEARSFGMVSIEQPRPFSDILRGRASGGIIGLQDGGGAQGYADISGPPPGMDYETWNRWYRQTETGQPIQRLRRGLERAETGGDFTRLGRFMSEKLGMGPVAADLSQRRSFMRQQGTPESEIDADLARRRAEIDSSRRLQRIEKFRQRSDPEGLALLGVEREYGPGREGGQGDTAATTQALLNYAEQGGNVSEEITAMKKEEADQLLQEALTSGPSTSAEFDISQHPLTAERMERMEAHQEWLREPTESDVAYEDFLGGIAEQYRGRIPSDEQNLARERSEILDSLIAGFGATGRGGFSKAFREAGGTKDVWLERDRQKAEREKYEDAADAIIAKRHGIQTLRSRQNVAEKADTILSDLLREMEANKRTYATGQAGIAAAYQQVVAVNLHRDPRQYEALRDAMNIAEINGSMTKEEHDLVEEMIVQDIMRGMSSGPEPGVQTTSRIPMQFGPSQTGSNVGNPR